MCFWIRSNGFAINRLSNAKIRFLRWCYLQCKMNATDWQPENGIFIWKYVCFKLQSIEIDAKKNRTTYIRKQSSTQTNSNINDVESGYGAKCMIFLWIWFSSPFCTGYWISWNRIESKVNGELFVWCIVLWMQFSRCLTLYSISKTRNEILLLTQFLVKWIRTLENIILILIANTVRNSFANYKSNPSWVHLRCSCQFLCYRGINHFLHLCGTNWFFVKICFAIIVIEVNVQEQN